MAFVSLGLGEVLCALGTSRLETLMPEVISTTERTELASHVREGYLMLYIYLPSTFKDDFIPWVGPVIPSVLKVRFSYSVTNFEFSGVFSVL